MVLHIQHRGNTNGPNPELENSPDYIMEAYDADLNIELDVWYHEGKFWLGHDKPQYKTTLMFLYDIHTHLWAHAKNMEVLPRLLEKGINCFWHQTDDCVLTSGGYIWVYPGKPIVGDRSIAVMPETVPDWDISKAYGICSDYVLNTN